MTAVDATAEAADHPKPPRWVMPTALVPIVSVMVAGWIAGSVWPRWHRDHPLALIALSPLNRFLILTTNELDVWSYMLVGLGRHLFPDPFFYMLGWWFGARALRWGAEGNAIAERLVGTDGRGLEDPAHRKFLYPLAFFMPNNWVSLLCGAAHIPIATFAVLNVTGTLGRLLVCRWIGWTFSDQIRSISNFIGDYQWWFTVVSVIGVLIAMAVQLRPGGQFRRLTELDDE